MKAADVMTRAVVTTTPESPIEGVARTMIQHGISGVPVVNADGSVVGIVTEGDLLRRAEIGTERSHSRWVELLLSGGRLAREYIRSHGRRVRDVMTKEVVTAAPETPLAEVVAFMEARRINRVPILDDGQLVGIISRADLLKALADFLPKVRAVPISDAEIRRRVLEEIDRQRWTPQNNIDAKVEDGTVELRGIILSKQEREALRIAAENVPGVKSIRDRLTWVEPISGTVIDSPGD
jgi:CBS domain-containing protein